MATNTALSFEQIDRRVAAAQRVTVDFDKCTTQTIKKLIKCHANSIGSPLEFIFFPLLSVTSHFMGPYTRVEVNDHWKEPPIIWNVVLADKGQKKSPAINRLLQPIQELEADMAVADEDGEQEEHTPHQIYIEHFSMEELHYTLKRNSGRVVGMYDEISLLYEQLDKYKTGISDRKTLLSLINGSPWKRNFRNSTSVVPKTWFNVAGFVQTDVIVNLLNGNDYDGFADRQFFVCPAEIDVDYDEMKEMPEDVPNFKDIFSILDEQHRPENTTYSFEDDAHLEFVAFHDDLNERKRQENRRDRDRKSVLAKAKGQVVRLASVIYALHQAITTSKDPTQEWSYVIPKEHLSKAIVLMNYLIEQKFALGKPPTQVASSTAQDTSNAGIIVDEHRVRRLLELPSPITSTKITQNHVQKRVDKKYRKEEADALMADAVTLGFGEFVLEEFKAAGGKMKTRKVFTKRKFEELPTDKKEFLKRIKIDIDKYSL